MESKSALHVLFLSLLITVFDLVLFITCYLWCDSSFPLSKLHCFVLINGKNVI